MKDIGIKKNILKEIMEMMDEHESDGLRKHPKLVKAEIDIVKPEEEVSVDESVPEVIEHEAVEPKEVEEEELSEEMKAKLLEMYRSIKD